MTAEITIRILPKAMEIVEEHVFNARLFWQAPGLNISVSGCLPDSRYPAALQLALHEAIARGIPASDLRSVHRRVPASPAAAIPKRQKKLL